MSYIHIPNFNFDIKDTTLISDFNLGYVIPDEDGKCMKMTIFMNPITNWDGMGYFTVTVSTGVEIKCYKKSSQAEYKVDVYERRHKLKEANELYFKMLKLKETQRDLWVVVEIVILHTA